MSETIKKKRKTIEKATYERVKSKLESTGQIVLTTKDEFEKEQTDKNKKPIQNSWKKVKYSNADGTPAESLYYDIIRKPSLNINKAQKAELNKKISEQQKQFQPKGVSTNNMKEEHVINLFMKDLVAAEIIDEDTSSQSVHLMEFRNYDFAIPEPTGQVMLYNALQAKTRMTEDLKDQWSTHVTVGEILKYIKEGGAVICACYTETQFYCVWFFFDDSGFWPSEISGPAPKTLIEILESQKKKSTVFAPVPSNTKTTGSSGVGLNFDVKSYRFTKLKGQFESMFNFWRNNQKTLKKTIEFLNHDKSQIKNTQNIENATFLALRDALRTSERSTSFIHKNYTQIDAVVGIKVSGSNDVIITSLQLKALSKNNSVIIRKDNKLPYDRNLVDTFAFLVRDPGNDTTERCAWTRVLLFSNRNTQLDIIKANLYISKYKKNEDYFDFSLKDDVEKIVDKLLEFQAIPKLSEEAIQNDKEAANADDNVRITKRVAKEEQKAKKARD